MPARSSLIVAVPTFRRPQILELGLARIVEQAQSLTAITAQVIVIDNDPDRSAAPIAQRHPHVRYISEPAPGIVAVRNRALDEAGDADLLVFIDDDEVPADGWLAALVHTWQSTGADAVWGRVVSVFDTEPDPWITAGGFFVRARRRTGDRLPVAACGNLLLHLPTVRRLGLRFDARMGLGGGEDTLFTRQLARGGGVIVWCDESVAYDRVQAARVTRRWVLARAASHGNCSVRVDRYLAPPGFAQVRIRARAIAGGSARAVLGSMRTLLGYLRRSTRDKARGARIAYRGAGILAGGLGFSYQEYGRSGGHWIRERHLEENRKGHTT